MATDMQTAIANASRTVRVRAYYRPAKEKPEKPGVFRVMRGNYRRWDGSAWHKGARDPKVAAKTDSPLPVSEHEAWCPIAEWQAANPGRPVITPSSKSKPLRNGHGAPPTLAAQGQRLIALGRAMQDPDKSIRELQKMSQEAGFSLDLAFRNIAE